MPDNEYEAKLTNRQQQLIEFFVNQYSNLEAVAFDAYPGLTVWDCEKVMAFLESRLFAYKGPLDAAAFEKWAAKIVTKEAQRFEITLRILVEHKNVIHKAIHAGMRQSAVDLSVGHDDIFQELAGLVFRMAHSLAKKGTASLSTRLYSLTLRHIDLYHTRPNNRRHRLNRERVEAGLPYGVESISAEELAAERAAQFDDES